MNEKTLGSVLDQLFELRETKKELAKEQSAIQAEMDKLERQISEQMEALGLEKIAGTKATATLRAEIYPSVSDKAAFYNFVVQNQSYELTQSRINAAAYRERLMNGDVLPDGVTTYDKIKLSIRKK